MYYERIIDQYLCEWAARSTHKPVLLRGARQVGKSTAVRHLGEQFKLNYMRERKLSQAIRCSLENFGEFDYTDNQADGAIRHVHIFPLYAIHVFHKLSER